MASFTITAPDGKEYEVTGDTAEGALAALQDHLGGNEGSLPYGQPPEGMVYDEKSGRMMDTGAIADATFGDGVGTAAAAAGRFASGFPVVGAALERYSGMGDPVRQGVVDQGFENFDREHPKTSAGLRIGGAITGIAPLVAAAPAAFGASGAQGLGAASLASAGSGAAIGGADAAVRSGFDPMQTGLGLAVGGATGAAGPVVAKGLGAAANTIGGTLGIGNAGRADSMIARGFRRARMTTEDVARSLETAQADDQGMFMIADALGHPGQRMLSGAFRTPGESRNRVAEALFRRQSGQGDRLSSFMSKGFGAPDTAAQRASTLNAARKRTADKLYAAVRSDAGPVNITPAIQTLDDLAKRNPILGESALDKTEIGKRIASIRGKMAKGGEQLIDFDTVLNVKQDLGGQIERVVRSGGNVPPQLAKVYSSLDDALEKASQGYREANDKFRAMSRVIDAVDKGKSSASGRVRANDSISAFDRMTGQEKAAFRAGYVDPLIARVENASSSPTTNKARMLLTEKTTKEFPAFARPSKAEKMTRQIGREQDMFETTNQVMGGSRTADNLADTAELASIDPSIIGSLARGRVGQAFMQLVQSGANRAGGVNPAVRDRVIDTLTITDPEAARGILAQSVNSAERRQLVAEALIRAMSQGGALQAVGN